MKSAHPMNEIRRTFNMSYPTLAFRFIAYDKFKHPFIALDSFYIIQ